MKLEMTNFQAVAANWVAEGDVCDLACAKPATQPETDTEIALIIQKLGATSIADIDNLVSELQEARSYLQSEGERIRAEVARYTALTGAASASVKIIFDALRAWRKEDRSAHNQSQASAFEITDVIDDASDWDDGPSRSFG
jgi:uncharacterized small protein (DUF1192 family)